MGGWIALDVGSSAFAAVGIPPRIRQVCALNRTCISSPPSGNFVVRGFHRMPLAVH